MKSDPKANSKIVALPTNGMLIEVVKNVNILSVQSLKIFSMETMNE